MSNSEVVECLLGHGATVDLPAGKNGITALHLSCRKGDPRSEKCVKMLLKSGANPNFPMVEEGRTALHEAASQPNSARILRLLLENGADVGKVDVNGEMALHAAVKSCNFKAVKVREKGFLLPSRMYEAPFSGLDGNFKALPRQLQHFCRTPKRVGTQISNFFMYYSF